MFSDDNQRDHDDSGNEDGNGDETTLTKMKKYLMMVRSTFLYTFPAYAWDARRPAGRSAARPAGRPGGARVVRGEKRRKKKRGGSGGRQHPG